MEEEEDVYDFQAVAGESEPTFEDLAAAVLVNADIDMPDCLRATRVAAEATAAAQVQASNGPHLVEADPDKIVYKIALELPCTGLLPGVIPHAPDETTNRVARHAE